METFCSGQWGSGGKEFCHCGGNREGGGGEVQEKQEERGKRRRRAGAPSLQVVMESACLDLEDRSTQTLDLPRCCLLT